MNDGTPWGHLQHAFDQRQRFEDALPGLMAHGLNGEDLGILLNNPSSELVSWMYDGSGEVPVQLSAAEAPPAAVLSPRREGHLRLLGWFKGANAIEGLGLFTESDVFELHQVQFAVIAEPLRPVVYGELVTMRVLALNCTEAPLSLSVRIEAERGVVQSPRHYLLSLEPGVITLALLPVRVCPLNPSVVPIVAAFDTEGVRSRRRWRFSARPYAKPAQQLAGLVAGATEVAAAVGLTPVYLRSGAANQGSPDPIRLRPDLARPLVAPQQEAACWRLIQLT